MDAKNKAQNGSISGAVRGVVVPLRHTVLLAVFPLKYPSSWLSMPALVQAGGLGDRNASGRND